jgi:hypothetical protein
LSVQCLLNFPPPEGDITALHCNVKSVDESFGEAMYPLEGVNFELITYSGFRGRIS